MSMSCTKFELRSYGIAIVMLSRPKALNALNTQLMTELVDHFERCDRDPGIRAVVLTGDPASVTGSGSTIYCAGADLGKKDEKGQNSSAGAWAQETIATHRDSGGKVTLAIHRCRKPVIAAINGTAVGGASVAPPTPRDSATSMKS